jgi:hypothetical protein
VDHHKSLDEGDGLIVDIMTGVRTMAEETYSLPVIMDQEWVKPEDIRNAPVVNGVVVVNGKNQVKKR